MNPDAYKNPQPPKPQAWACPCSGCAKAVKQERLRITEALEAIDLNTTSQINAVGLKILILDIINKRNDVS